MKKYVPGLVSKTGVCSGLDIPCGSDMFCLEPDVSKTAENVERNKNDIRHWYTVSLTGKLFVDIWGKLFPDVTFADEEILKVLLIEPKK